MNFMALWAGLSNGLTHTERAQLLGREAELDEQEEPRRGGLDRLARQK